MSVVDDTTSNDQPMTHARIGYQKISGLVDASTADDGFPASAADSPLTYSGWKPTTTPAWWKIDAGDNQTVNYVGIASHTLGTVGASVKVQYGDGSSPESWSDATSVHEPADDSPILFLFDAVSAPSWRLYIDIDTSPQTMPLLGVVFIGSVLEMPRMIYGGHTPITLARNTVVRPTRSERGQWLGRSIIRGGSVGSWSWRYLDPSWYRTYFDPFVEAARTQPFFIAWRPGDFPDEVGYVWTSGDIRPGNMGVKGFMEVSLEAEGLAIE